MIIDSVCELVVRGKRDQVFLVVCVLQNSLSLWPKRRDASCSMVAYVVPVGTVKRRISLRPCRLAVILMSIPDIARRRRKKPGERFLHLLGGPKPTQRRSDDGENGPIAEEV